MMTWKKFAYAFYPIFIILLLAFLFLIAGTFAPVAKAGIIRRADLSTERPLVVRLALGRSTAVSFATRPEKVVPGNPQALEINFLGKDLTLRPLGQKPGNLLIYTKSSRYVILLTVTSEDSYDDAIVVNSIGGGTRPIRLAEDAFTIEELVLRDEISKKEETFTAILRREGRQIESDSLPVGIKCKGCVAKGNQLLCANASKNLECTFDKKPHHILFPKGKH